MQRRGGGRALGAVLFTDIVSSTSIAAEMGNTRWVELVARHHRIVRRQIGRLGGREIDTAGDGFFITFERPADAIRCAVSIAHAVRELGIEIRAGVSFGELEAAGRKPGGLVVNTAARVMAVGGPGEVLVPASVREIVPGAGITFADHGVHRLRGLDDEFHLFSVTGVDGAEVAPPLENDQAAQRRRDIFPTVTRQRRALFVGIGAGLLALLVGAWLLLSGGPEEPQEAAGPLRNAVARIEVDSGAVGSRVQLAAAALGTSLSFIDHPMVVGQGGVWLMRPPFLLHIDPKDVDVRSDRIEIGVATSQTVASGFDAIWVLSDRTLFRVHPGTDEVRPFLILPLAGGIATYALALDNRYLWIGDSDGSLVRMDPSTGARNQSETGVSIDLIAATSTGPWLADIVDGVVRQVDRETLRLTGEEIAVGGDIDQMVGVGDDLWILDAQVGVVTQLDTTSGAVRGTARVGNEPTDIAIGGGALWASDLGGSLYRAEVSTLDVQEFPIGAEVLGVAVDPRGQNLWAYLGEPTGSVAGG